MKPDRCFSITLIVALVDFCSSVLQDYIVKRLLSFAHSRRASPRLHYDELCGKMRDVSTSHATVVDGQHYLVPSQRKQEILYTVDAQFGLCACPAGQTGAFCKHQAFVHERFQIPFPNSPAVTLEDRHMLAALALGDKCPHKDFFKHMQDTDDSETIDDATAANSSVGDDPRGIAGISFDGRTEVAEAVDVTSIMAEAHKEVMRLKSLVDDDVAIALRAVLPCLKNISNKAQLISALYQCRSSLRVRKGGSIRVQPTSIARRRSGVTRGCKRIAAGRPLGARKRAAKKPRCLAANVQHNTAHAKSHGAGH